MSQPQTQDHLHLHSFETPGNRIYDAIALLDSLHSLAYRYPLLTVRALRVVKHSLVLSHEQLCMSCQHGTMENLDKACAALSQK